MKLTEKQIKCLIERQEVYSKLKKLDELVGDVHELAADVAGNPENGVDDFKKLDRMEKMMRRYVEEVSSIVDRYQWRTPKIVAQIK